MNLADINARFEHQTSSDPDIAGVYDIFAENAKILARSIDACCTDGRQKSLALTKLEEAVLWACSSIRHDGLPDDLEANLNAVIAVMKSPDPTPPVEPPPPLSTAVVPPAFRPTFTGDGNYVSTIEEIQAEEEIIDMEEVTETPHIPDLLTESGELVPAPEAESERIITRRRVDVRDLPAEAAKLLRTDDLEAEGL